MPTYLTPGLYFETVDSGQTDVASVRTDIAAFVGIAERGPLHVPTPVYSWEQFQSVFGAFLPNSYLAYTIKAFFENGGLTCYIVRIAAPVAMTQTTNALQSADRLASQVESVEGFAPGAVVTVRQNPAQPQDILLQDVQAFPPMLFWESPLAAGFALNMAGNPLTFETGAAAAQGDLWDATGAVTLHIEAADPGAWGNALAVHVSYSSPAATRALQAAQPAARAASRVESVVNFPVGSLVKIFQAQAPTPLTAYRVVTGVDPGRGLLAWNTPLDAGFDLTPSATNLALLALPLAFETVELGLAVYQDRNLREVFSGLSLVAEHPRYVGGVLGVGTSYYIRVTDPNPISLADLSVPPLPFPGRLPDPTAANLNNGTLTLQSGRDGIAALQMQDFTGDPAAAQRTGLRTLENVAAVAIVAMPDILIQPTPSTQFAPLPKTLPDPCVRKSTPLAIAGPLPLRVFERAPQLSMDEIRLAQMALVQHCEMLRDRIALLDPPLFSQQSEAVDIAGVQSWRQNFDSTYAALYFPWPLVYDPLPSAGQVVRRIPPCGHVAGIFARTDVQTGVHKAPANAELFWAQGVTVEVNAEVQGVLNPQGINCVRLFPGRGLRLYGARTVSSDPLWRFVPVRRLMMMIEKALTISIQWAVFEPNSFTLRQTLILAVSSFLETLWQRGALVGGTAAEAFFVRCDLTTMTQADFDNGRLIALIGVAPVKPAEFVVFRIGRTQDELEIRELTGGIA